jgi:hypothetical protein
MAAFENRTQLAKYEALEKIGVSGPESWKSAHL